MVITLKAILTIMRVRESDGVFFWAHANNMSNTEPILWIDGLQCQTIATQLTMWCMNVRWLAFSVDADSTQQTGSRLLWSVS